MNKGLSLPKQVFQFSWDMINCSIPRGMYLVPTLTNELHVQNRFEQFLEFFGQNLHDVEVFGPPQNHAPNTKHQYLATLCDWTVKRPFSMVKRPPTRG